MAVNDALGDRMKENYENRYRISLTRRTPVIIRVDGKAFHTFTKHFEKPYDIIFKKSMWDTACDLCLFIQGAKFAYVQSDEISILLTDYKKLTSEAYFDYNLQKMVSVTASHAAIRFYKNMENNVLAAEHKGYHDWLKYLRETDIAAVQDKYLGYDAVFDARAFNIPVSEVVNYFVWRQQDATKNSIAMLGRCYASQKELHNLHSKQIRELLSSKYKVNWEDMPAFFKKGVAIIKESYIINEGKKDEAMRTRWIPLTHCPIFTQDRTFIEQYLGVEDDH